jgi:hypothetical protein
MPRASNIPEDNNKKIPQKTIEIDKEKMFCYKIMFEDVTEDYYKVDQTDDEKKYYLYNEEAKHHFLVPVKMLEDYWVADISSISALVDFKKANPKDYI